MIATTAAHLDDHLRQGSPVAFGISGGKDSTAMVLATQAYLDSIGHSGPRMLIHSDLGRIEWQQSMPMCQRLAEHTGLDLVMVRREAGDMVDRWLQRWRDNVSRYANLECVTLILPWSSPSLRFCTSELKTAVICRALVRQFPGQTIVNAVGIRREESPGRAKAVVAKEQPRLTNKTLQTCGYDWHPILDWTIAEVWTQHEQAHFPRHEAYTVYGSSRVSCAFCPLASRGDLTASAACAGNQAVYRELVRLEATSTFRFQSGQWLGDIAPHLLTDQERDDLDEARRRAKVREAAEARIPKHLRYVKGWPVALPSLSDAHLLASVRQEVAAAMGLPIRYTTASEVQERYRELLALKQQRESKQRTVPAAVRVEQDGQMVFAV